ncbi:uncharacterized protein [Amphiura filiformis]|uniref:uncharacterized protein n=1 Tax=Amphiura filiformis TaxID=82378 RepID=UPI003B217AC6
MNRYIENTMQMITKTAVLALGIPYLIVIAANVFYGWPSSRGEARYKALHPQRVYKQNYLILEQAALLKWLPLWLKWNQFYRSSDEASKDHTYGRNGNTLDIWKPDSISTSDDGEKKASKPVVVFIYGGAWGSGHKAMYGLLGQSLANSLGCVAVIPNYSTYPKGTAPDMLHDIEDTIHFIQSSDLIKSYGADINNIILVGHSAGAHLAAQLVVNLANSSKPLKHQEPSCIEPECDTNSETVHLDRGCFDNFYEYEIDMYMGDTDLCQSSNNAESSLNNAESSYHKVIHSIKGVVGIGGPYHIMDHYHHETWRGVEDFSPMWRAMHGLENFDQFSPTVTVKDLEKDQTNKLPSFLLIHGAKDTTVPIISSEKFADALSSMDVPVTLKVLVDGGHAEIALDMMESGRTFYDPMIGILRDWMKVNGIHTSVH